MAPMTGVLGVGLMGASVTFLVLSNVVVAVGCASGILARAQAQMPTVVDPEP